MAFNEVDVGLKDRKGNEYELDFELFYGSRMGNLHFECTIWKVNGPSVIAKIDDWYRGIKHDISISASRRYSCIKPIPSNLNDSPRKKVLWFVTKPLKFFEKLIKSSAKLYSFKLKISGSTILMFNHDRDDLDNEDIHFSKRDLLRFCKNLRVFLLTKLIRKYLNNKVNLSKKEYEKEILKDFIEVVMPFLKKCNKRIHLF
jgi:hypothetical protein